MLEATVTTPCGFFEQATLLHSALHGVDMHEIMRQQLLSRLLASDRSAHGVFRTDKLSVSAQAIQGHAPQHYLTLDVCVHGAPQGPLDNSDSRGKTYDVVGLSNLCLDIVVPVQQLPAAKDQALLEQLTACSHDKSSWELGGNCNFMIAAARIGMNVGSVGHVGDDVYGQYMNQVLQSERIESVQRLMPSALQGTELDKTLLCFVLVDPYGKHAFCSRYDFGPWPLLAGIDGLHPVIDKVLSSTAAVFTNGFVFDELPLEVVKTAIQTASNAGASILFDPGPRAFTMKSGSRRKALDTLMDMSDVILMTEEEAVEVTGLHDPQAAAEAVLARPGARTEWCVVKLGAEGALLVTKTPQQQVYRAKPFRVEVKDTVGCGDSFAAAIVLGYTRTHDVHATLLLANAVGAATAMGRGAGTNVADAQTVLRLLSEARTAASDSSTNANLSALHDLDNAIAILQDSLLSVDEDKSISGNRQRQARSPAHAA